jgi:hypothetical protein
MIERTKDNKYQVIRKCRINPQDPAQLDRIQKIKDNNGYDVILHDKINNLFLICNEISDAEIIVEESISKK